MNIIAFELRRNILAVLLWIMIPAIVGVGFVASYPYFTADLTVLLEVLAQYPRELIAGLGFGSIVIDTLLGFYGVVILYISITGAVFSFWLGINILSLENRSKTLDFLLTKPTRRATVFFAKVFVVYFYVLLFNVVLYSLLYFVCNHYNNGPVDFLLYSLLHSGLTLFTLVFAACGILFGTALKRVRSCAAVAIGFVGFNFVLSFVEEIINRKWFTHLTLFKYFPADTIIIERQLSLISMILCLFISFLALLTALFIYCRKEIRAV